LSTIAFLGKHPDHGGELEATELDPVCGFHG
jgi:hypothetical protein